MGQPALPEFVCRGIATFRPSDVKPADDGLIELLAADVGSAAPVADGSPSAAEAPKAPAVVAPELEIATAADVPSAGE